MMRETDEKTCQAQRDAGRRLGERITDVTFWRNELNTELEKLIQETSLLQETKQCVQKALEDTEPPLHLTQECLYHREGRTSIEKVHDHVEKSLLVEVDNLKSCQDKLKSLYEKICKQLADLRSAQYLLEDDLVGKEATLGIDSVCHQLNNYSRGINYFSGVEKCDPIVSSQETWASASSHRISRSHAERGKSAQLRSDSEALIAAVASAIWDCWSNSNNSLNKRSSEMMEAKNRVQLHLYKTQQEIFDIEKHIDLLRKAIQDKSNPLKVAQTRLEARNHRTHNLEMCRFVIRGRRAFNEGGGHFCQATKRRTCVLIGFCTLLLLYFQGLCPCASRAGSGRDSGLGGESSAQVARCRESAPTITEDEIEFGD